METDKNSENIAISRPEDWSEADWEALSPIQKARYATNPGLYRPGQSGRDGQKRPPGRPRKDGLPAGYVGAMTNPPASDPDAPIPQEPSFPVEDAGSVKDSLEANGLALVQDAFRRAARANGSGDPFDRMVYLTLLQKALPMATMKDLGKGLSGEAKRRKRALEELLAMHDPASDASFTPVASPVDGKEGGSDGG